MTAVGLCAVRAVHIRRPFPVSAHVRGRLEKLRHLASARLTCMVASIYNSIDLRLHQRYKEGLRKLEEGKDRQQRNMEESKTKAIK